jgi:hypothetical protein
VRERDAPARRLALDVDIKARNADRFRLSVVTFARIDAIRKPAGKRMDGVGSIAGVDEHHPDALAGPLHRQQCSKVGPYGVVLGRSPKLTMSE